MTSVAKLKELKWYEQFKIVNGVLAVASLFLLVIYWSVNEHVSSERGGVLVTFLAFLAKEVGMAGLIALFLNLSIEWVNRSRHYSQQSLLLEALEQKHRETSEILLNNVNKQLFETIYKRNVDSDVFSQVEEHLLKADTMRREFSAAFTLQPFFYEGRQTEFVKLRFRNSYKVCNLTKDPVFAPVVRIVLDVTPCFAEHSKFKRIKVGKEILSESDLKGVVRSIPDRDFISIVVEREVPPMGELPIEIEYEKLAPLNYVEIVTTTVAMDGLNIEIIDQSEFFTVDAISLHPVDERRKTPIGNPVSSQWILDKPILPGQGIVLLWHPKNAACIPGAIEAFAK